MGYSLFCSFHLNAEISNGEIVSRKDDSSSSKTGQKARGEEKQSFRTARPFLKALIK
jgi:hypothetical protein